MRVTGAPLANLVSTLSINRISLGAAQPSSRSLVKSTSVIGFFRLLH